MLHGGEDLALLEEATQRHLTPRLVRQQLDRRALAELIVSALGEIDSAHAAAADLVDDPIRPDALTYAAARSRAEGAHERRGKLRGGLVEKVVDALARAQQALHFAAHLVVDVGARCKPGPPLVDRQLEELVEQPLEQLPPLGGQRRHCRLASNASPWSSA